MKTHQSPILVLDAGGVLLDDLSLQFWQTLADKSTESNIDVAHLYQHYKRDISEALWVGRYSEQQFLEFLGHVHITLTLNELRSMIEACLQPLPAFEHVKTWSKLLPVYIMSNHRSEWLLPALEPLKPYLSDIYISDVFKIKKPTIDWFHQLSHIHTQNTIMFVDNTKHNLIAAEEAGWLTLYADSENKWINELDEWLAKTV